MKPEMGDSETAEYQYIVHVGNNGYADRLWRMFALGSVVLLVDTGWEEFYYSLLQPHRHYVPVRQDSSNLCGQLEWVRSHSAEAELIASRGREFIQKCLSIDFVNLYVAEVARQIGYLWELGHSRV
ncbi:unnamed protein product [Polarella glacialis]|uniref:Glycosyl transferase CAP10 domain-containing protein n=1 Tax=Polarella glacialis TaxID=89957 RepID=A0A813DWL5_POLGL|nr:unnamed protein product [Polarella glacialis]CAE8712641.1 unnamed protein product [Polarella glacialis]